MVLVKLPVETEPVDDLLPLQAPEAVQLVAAVVLQVRVELLPETRLVGAALREIVGADMLGVVTVVLVVIVVFLVAELVVVVVTVVFLVTGLTTVVVVVVIGPELVVFTTGTIALAFAVVRLLDGALHRVNE